MNNPRNHEVAKDYDRLADEHRASATRWREKAQESGGFERTAALDQARQHDETARRFDGYAQQARGTGQWPHPRPREDRGRTDG